MIERKAKERKLAALAEAVAEYGRRHGEISDAEITAQRRLDQRRAIVVGGSKAAPHPRRSRKG